MLAFNARPLENFSSLHKISLLNALGIKSKSTFPSFSIVIDFNLQKPLQKNPSALMTFHLRDSDTPPIDGGSDFCIANMQRWRLNISQYGTFTGYLQKLSRKYYRRFEETRKAFIDYGATIKVLEEDWSQYAEEVYRLYTNVAEKHGTLLYDLNYFRDLAKQSNSKLMCAWYKGSLIAVLIIIDEQPILHSICCGLDYDHSKTAQAYSWMHYELIRLAIESKKFTIVDIGPTANEAKRTLGFQPVSSCMDVWAHNGMIRGLLRFLSLFMTATINSKAKLQLGLRLPGKKSIL